MNRISRFLLTVMRRSCLPPLPRCPGQATHPRAHTIARAKERTALLLRSLTAACALALALLPGVALANTPYVVVPGDTLGDIAIRHGTTVAELAALNGLPNPDFIYSGQLLALPPKTAGPTEPISIEQPSTASQPECSSVIHTVQSGDTLSAIASRYGVTVAQIASANGIANPSLIRVGQVLEIPSNLCLEPLLLDAAFSKVSWSPDRPVQGDTVRLSVTTAEPTQTLRGYFGEMPVRFVSQGTTHVAYLGVPAIAEPGFRQLQLLIDDQPRQVLAIPIREGQFGVERLVLPPDRAVLLAPEIVQRENELLAAITGSFTDEVMWEEAFQHPLEGNPPVISPFGTKRAYNGGPVASYHGGVDFPGAEGSSVRAAASGRVAFAAALDVRGNTVIVDHGAGVFTFYCHLSEIQAKENDLVVPGQVVGLLGNTGLSTGPHLHWEMRVQGTRVDPLRLLSASTQ